MIWDFFSSVRSWLINLFTQNLDPSVCKIYNVRKLESLQFDSLTGITHNRQKTHIHHGLWAMFYHNIYNLLRGGDTQHYLDFRYNNKGTRGLAVCVAILFTVKSAETHHWPGIARHYISLAMPSAAPKKRLESGSSAERKSISDKRKITTRSSTFIQIFSKFMQDQERKIPEHSSGAFTAAPTSLVHRQTQPSHATETVTRGSSNICLTSSQQRVNVHQAGNLASLPPSLSLFPSFHHPREMDFQGAYKPTRKAYDRNIHVNDLKRKYVIRRMRGKVCPVSQCRGHWRPDSLLTFSPSYCLQYILFNKYIFFTSHSAEMSAYHLSGYDLNFLLPSSLPLHSHI